MDDGWGFFGNDDVGVSGQATDVDDLLATEQQMVEDPVVLKTVQQPVAMVRPVMLSLGEEIFEEDEEVDQLDYYDHDPFLDEPTDFSDSCSAIDMPFPGPSGIGSLHTAEPSISLSPGSGRTRSTPSTSIESPAPSIPSLSSPEEMRHLRHLDHRLEIPSYSMSLYDLHAYSPPSLHRCPHEQPTPAVKARH